MKNILAFLVCVLVADAAFATGENIATSKAYVDTAVAQKQDAILANDGAVQVLTNTGTAGAVGTKNIYDSTGAYGEQIESLVTAGDFNTAVQNAIDAEFECIAWRNPDDHSSDCMLVKIKSKEYSIYDLIGSRRNEPIFGRNYNSTVTFDSETKIATMLILNESANRGNATFGINSSNYGAYISGHKYYFYAKMRITTPGVTVSIFRDTRATVYMHPTTEWGVHGSIFEASFPDDGSWHYPVIEYNYPGVNEGIMVDQNVFGIYDLTEIFGAGNEPTTPVDAAQELNLVYMPSNE